MLDSERAKEIISKIIYITIATVSRDGLPWNTPAYSSFDENYNFFWVSSKEAVHSMNIRNNPNVFLAIYDSTVKEGSGEGVYIKAKAYELKETAEMEHAAKCIYGRKNKPVKPIENFMGDSPRRFYKAVPEKVWLNGGEKVNGFYVDFRKEVELT